MYVTGAAREIFQRLCRIQIQLELGGADNEINVRACVYVCVRVDTFTAELGKVLRIPST